MSCNSNFPQAVCTFLLMSQWIQNNKNRQSICVSCLIQAKTKLALGDLFLANERAYIYCVLRPENKGHSSCSFCGCFILILIHFNFNNATKIKLSPTVNPEATTDELKHNKRQVTIIDHMQGIEMIASICSRREATAARLKKKKYYIPYAQRRL